MSADEFFDSNVLLYLLSDDRAPHVEQMLLDGGTISVQVLNEIAAVALGKFKQPLGRARAILNGVRSACAVHDIGIATHERGLDIAERYRFTIFDSMLLASALEAGCTTFFSEDMQHGQRIGGLTIRNPFNP